MRNPGHDQTHRPHTRRPKDDQRPLPRHTSPRKRTQIPSTGRRATVDFHRSSIGAVSVAKATRLDPRKFACAAALEADAAGVGRHPIYHALSDATLVTDLARRRSLCLAWSETCSRSGASTRRVSKRQMVCVLVYRQISTLQLLPAWRRLVTTARRPSWAADDRRGSARSPRVRRCRCVRLGRLLGCGCRGGVSRGCWRCGCGRCWC